MAVINHAKREINAKLVFFGPAGSGKASLFSYIHKRVKPSLCGPLKSMPAGGDTLQFFDYLPFEHAILDGYRVRLHLYTLTGPVENPGTWKMTLKGADGLALVVEKGMEQSDLTVQSLRYLRSIVTSHGRDLLKTPCVLISTKADQLEQKTVDWGAELATLPRVQSSIMTGEGVLQALTSLSQAVFQRLREEQQLQAATTLQACVNEQADDDQPPEPAIELFEGSALEGVPVLQAGEATTLQVPVMLQVAGVPRRFALRITLNLEEVGDGHLGV